MAEVAFWLVLGFFVGSLAIIWWILYVDHDLREEPYEEDVKSSNPLAGVDGVSLAFVHWLQARMQQILIAACARARVFNESYVMHRLLFCSLLAAEYWLYSKPNQRSQRRFYSQCEKRVLMSR